MSTKDHGHGYEDQDPGDWIPGVELDAKISMPPVLELITRNINVGSPGRILDVGCGPGVGTIDLANLFPNASVVGLDIGEAVLEAATDRAAAENLSDRVSFLRADFDQDLTGQVEAIDMVFASMSLHHTEDPGAAVGRVCQTLVPGGRLVMAEFGRPLTMWPSDNPAVTGGVWERWQATADAFRLDHLGPASVSVDWPQLLTDQGLTQVEQFECDVQTSAPLGALERAWLLKGLHRGLGSFGDRLDSADRVAIEAMADPDNPDGVANSAEVFVDTSRMIFTGVRP
jgi:SAM-dependent methyltransferase